MGVDRGREVASVSEGSLSLDCAAHGVLGHSTQRSGRARWPGRHRAEGLGGVKLIALIPLHVYHLDPGNYHGESLTPISEQMLMVGNRWERNRSRMGKAGSAWGNPRDSARMAGSTDRNATGECGHAGLLCLMALQSSTGGES